VEALGFFYLMAQYLNKERSFWKPYLDTLPTPEQGFNSPFWFDDDDLKWLEGTDLHPSFLGRKEAWQRYWRQDTKVMAKHGMNTDRYTW